MKKECPACKNEYKGFNKDTPNLCKYHKGFVLAVEGYAIKHNIFPELKSRRAKKKQLKKNE